MSSVENVPTGEREAVGVSVCHEVSVQIELEKNCFVPPDGGCTYNQETLNAYSGSPVCLLAPNCT